MGTLNIQLATCEPSKCWKYFGFMQQTRHFLKTDKKERERKSVRFIISGFLDCQSMPEPAGSTSRDLSLQQTHAAHQLWTVFFTPFSLSFRRLPPNHNNPKSAKTYQSSFKPGLQKASRPAFMGLSNSSWYFIQLQIQFSSYKRFSITGKILVLILCS